VFAFEEDAPLNGIIAHLTRQCGGNVHDFGVVEVRAYQPLSGREAHIADLGHRHDYCSNTGPDQWIGYDFKGMRVNPTRYTLRSRYGRWSGQMNRWVIEGSLDGEDWLQLAQGHEPDGFVPQGVVHSYPMERGVESRYIRIRELPNGGSNIILSAFELFGTLFDE
jgi:hypothetical protein